MRKDYETLSFFKSGKRRRAVIMALEEPHTPKEVSIICHISISNASNALSELVKKGYVELINKNAHTYKYYGLSQKGTEAVKLLKAEE